MRKRFGNRIHEVQLRLSAERRYQSGAAAFVVHGEELDLRQIVQELACDVRIRGRARRESPAERVRADGGGCRMVRVRVEDPHYVVSSTLKSVTWPNTRILADLDAVAAMKREQGKDIYLMGGAAIVGAALDAGLVDELRLIVYPLIVGEGKALFSSSARHAMELHKVEQLPDGRLSLV